MTRKTIREFVNSLSGEQALGRRQFRAWLKVVEKNSWESFNELRETLPSADLVGECIVFDIGHNRYRLIAKIDYDRKILYVRRVMNHAEYDLKKWVEQCNCHLRKKR